MLIRLSRELQPQLRRRLSISRWEKSSWISYNSDPDWNRMERRNVVVTLIYVLLITS